MTLVSAVFVPVVFLSIRKITIAKLGLQQAGFWTTIDIFSGYYFLFIATLLSVFYFPKLAVAQSGNQTKKLFYQYFKTTIPIFGIGLILIYFLRTFIIKLLFDESFLPVANLFFYQLIGDFFKAISLVLAYNLIAKKHTFWYIVFEITSVSTMYFLSLYFLEIYKIQGILMAHCLTYLLYCGALFFYNRKSLV
jgi:PST family polysaccharide transporter